MGDFVKRPRAAFGAGQGGGLLRHDHFQVCHVTNDMARAQSLYREQLGIRNFQPLEGQLPEGGSIHIELAWVGGLMYELATASGPGSEPFTEILPPGDAFAMRFHHLGYFIHDQASWDALDGEIARGGGIVRAGNAIAGFMQFRIVQVPWLGHFLEFIHPEPQGIAFFENVPVN